GACVLRGEHSVLEQGLDQNAAHLACAKNSHCFTAQTQPHGFVPLPRLDFQDTERQNCTGKPVPDAKIITANFSPLYFRTYFLAFAGSLFCSRIGFDPICTVPPLMLVLYPFRSRYCVNWVPAEYFAIARMS